MANWNGGKNWASHRPRSVAERGGSESTGGPGTVSKAQKQKAKEPKRTVRDIPNVTGEKD